jgi:hypothetical protein
MSDVRDHTYIYHGHSPFCRFEARGKNDDPWVFESEQDMDEDAPLSQRWIWRGYLARGALTLFTGEWKAGKSTLLANLCAAMGRDASFLDQPLAAARILYLTEEPRWVWLERRRAQPFGPHIRWLFRPFYTLPNQQVVEPLFRRLCDMASRDAFDLLIVDTLSSFLPLRNEGNPACVADALDPLCKVAYGCGAAVLLVHHPAKGVSLTRQLARGSGTLSSRADIVLELSYANRHRVADGRRELRACSRFQESAPRVLVHLDPATGRYATVPPRERLTAPADPGWQTLHRVLAAGPAKATRQELLDRWPADLPKPHRNVLWRWLDRAVYRGLIVCQRDEGARAFRYSLPGASTPGGKEGMVNREPRTENRE